MPLWSRVVAWCPATMWGIMPADAQCVYVYNVCVCGWCWTRVRVPPVSPLCPLAHCFAAPLHYFGALARSLSLWPHYWSHRQRARGGWLNRKMNDMQTICSARRNIQRWRGCRARSYRDREGNTGGRFALWTFGGGPMYCIGPTSVSWVLYWRG